MAEKGFDNKTDIVQNAASSLGNVLSTKPTAKFASGARTMLKINNTPCGFAFSVSWRITTMVTEINTIDNYSPWELAPQRVSVEGTLSALHIPGQGVGVQLWQPDILNFLTQQYITIEVRDQTTDQTLFFTDKAMITTRLEDIKVDSLASVQLTWKAIGFKDERVPKRANGPKEETAATPLKSLANAVTNLFK